MTRKESRELAFVILFEQTVTGGETEEIVECAKESRDIEPDAFTKDLVFGVEKNGGDVEEIISKNIKGWNLTRLSKVTYAILKLSVFEIKFMPNIPVSVSINEAVELAKRYGEEKSSEFINGVLAKIAKK